VSDPAPIAVRLIAVEQRYPLLFGLRHKRVLTGIDLEIPRGRTLGLAGPNGSGKSTLLRILAGVDRASAGTVEVLGGSPARARVRRRVGYLSEDSPFPLELSARLCLELLGSLQGVRGAELKAETARLLALVGLEREARTRLGRYSRGMLRRFGLAQAWIHRPDLLLLDEPTAGLDAQGFEVLETLLAEARARSATIVLSSHIVADILDRCDDLAVLLDGRVAERGAPRDVLRGRTLLDLYRGASRR
jgi:ABC-2 type transport system ATP-binding protein